MLLRYHSYYVNKYMRKKKLRNNIGNYGSIYIFARFILFYYI